MTSCSWQYARAGSTKQVAHGVWSPGADVPVPRSHLWGAPDHCAKGTPDLPNRQRMRVDVHLVAELDASDAPIAACCRGMARIDTFRARWAEPCRRIGKDQQAGRSCGSSSRRPVASKSGSLPDGRLPESIATIGPGDHPAGRIDGHDGRAASSCSRRLGAAARLTHSGLDGTMVAQGQVVAGLSCRAPGGGGRASQVRREARMPLLLHLADVHLGARHADMGAAAVQQRERQLAAFGRAIDVALRSGWTPCSSAATSSTRTRSRAARSSAPSASCGG